jgi:hypothetical protein
MTFAYELAVLGTPTTQQITELEESVAATVLPFGLQLGREIRWAVRPTTFRPAQQRAAAAVFFGGEDPDVDDLEFLISRAIPVLPVVNDANRVTAHLPSVLESFNCLIYGAGGAQRVATALLECAGLLPRQRRVFLSYRRDEARQAALQLFDAFSARLFDVFLDTHGIAPGDDFQAVLWHRLCDSDVLVMLDTSSYFESRWTNAEFGRALAKGISVLRIGWPDCTPSPRTATASRAELLAEEIEPATGRIANVAIDRICRQLELVRSQSHAVRQVNLFSNLRFAVERIGGTISGVGLRNAVYVHLPNGTNVVAYPTAGVPTSTTLHDAATNEPDRTVAVVYDHVGLHPDWVGHLDWLGSYIRRVRWVKASEAAWRFSDWET